MGNILDINLTDGSVGSYEIDDETRRKYLGGKGLAARILYDTMKGGVDPLSPDNVLIIMTGPLTGTGAPCSSRFDASMKSPLTGAILSSNCGGNFGIRLKRAGYDAMIIRGRSEDKVYINITEDNVEIKDASELWGMNTEEVQQKLDDIEGNKTGKIVIGPAGENAVLYAAIISQERALGRGGAGAVMGSKNLKAVVANGNKKVPIAKPKKFKRAVKKWAKKLKEHPSTGDVLPRYGTGNLINLTNAGNILPTRNFQAAHFEDAELISGEYMAEHHLKRNAGCVSCPIKCGRVIELEGKEVKGPEYETLAMFGANIDNKDITKIYEWNHICDLMGMDTISAANCIAFAMELGEKGMLETDLRFGNVDSVSQMLYDIANRNGLGNDLADGVKRMSEKHGGKEFAMHVKGMEPPGYDPRSAVGQGLGYATANRGACHIDGGYVVYLEVLGPLSIDPFAIKSKPELAVIQQNLFNAIACSISCVFTSYAFLPKITFRISPHGFIGRQYSNIMTGQITRFNLGKIIKISRGRGFPIHIVPHEKVLSAITGAKFYISDFMKVGERAFNIERMFNIREGFAPKDDTLPKRWLEEPSADTGAVFPLYGLYGGLFRYYELRGWDEDGAPTPELLETLGIET